MTLTGNGGEEWGGKGEEGRSGCDSGKKKAKNGKNIKESQNSEMFQSQH